MEELRKWTAATVGFRMRDEEVILKGKIPVGAT
jgi:hypothetical protein